MRRTLLVILLAALGCGGNRPSLAEQARVDRAVVGLHDGLASCFREVLADKSGVSGVVEISFAVRAQSGAVSDIHIEGDEPGDARLRACAVQALSGLTVSPPPKTRAWYRIPIRFRAYP